MKSEQISEFLQSRIDARDFPSAVYLVAEKGEIVFQDALGSAVVEPVKIEAHLDTIYDVASLTKVLITGLLCAKAIESGELKLTDKVEEFLPDFDDEAKREITIENLLTHTSGFPAWLPFYLLYDAPKIENSYGNKEKFAARRNVIRQEISEVKLENPVNSKVVYSDLNFITLAFILEKIYNRPFELLAQSPIFYPLALTHTRFKSREEISVIHADFRDYAASEKGNFYEKNTCRELGYEVENYDWREDIIWGDVHDGNCWFMGGVSGHAGIFSNAFEIYKIARQFLAEETIIFKPETCKLFRTNFTPHLNEARSIAFQLAETADSTAGQALSSDSFGHLGFTGTSLWINPQKERIFILLTNRTHAHELPFININSVRRKFHEIASAILDKKD